MRGQVRYWNNEKTGGVAFAPPVLCERRAHQLSTESRTSQVHWLLACESCSRQKVACRDTLQVYGAPSNRDANRRFRAQLEGTTAKYTTTRSSTQYRARPLSYRFVQPPPSHAHRNPNANPNPRPSPREPIAAGENPYSAYTRRQPRSLCRGHESGPTSRFYSFTDVSTPFP